MNLLEGQVGSWCALGVRKILEGSVACQSQRPDNQPGNLCSIGAAGASSSLLHPKMKLSYDERQETRYVITSSLV